MQSSWKRPALACLAGSFVTLKPLDPTHDTDQLYNISHGDQKKESVWKYLSYGPFHSAEEMSRLYSSQMSGIDPLAWTAHCNARKTQVGITTLMSIVPDHGRAEIGHVWFCTEVHRTKINTEAQYLLLKYLFEDLGYRRVEWKCDAQNHASRTAATRMGFLFEGRFRQHMVIRGRNRDTDWFAMCDKDWPRCRDNFEKWLYGPEGISLSELNTA